MKTPATERVADQCATMSPESALLKMSIHAKSTETVLSDVITYARIYLGCGNIGRQSAEFDLRKAIAKAEPFIK